MIDTLNPGFSDLPEMEGLLIDDIRLLGSLLGETIRDQEGAETFETIEKIRRLSSPSNMMQTRLQARNSISC